MGTAIAASGGGGRPAIRGGTGDGLSLAKALEVMSYRGTGDGLAGGPRAAPIAWRLPETAVRFGRPARSRQSGDSSRGATRALALPRDADAGSRHCRRRLPSATPHPPRAPANAVWAANPTARPVHCRAVANGCVSGHPDCMSGSASALNLVVWAESSGFGPLGKRNWSG